MFCHFSLTVPLQRFKLLRRRPCKVLLIEVEPSIHLFLYREYLFLFGERLKFTVIVDFQ